MKIQHLILVALAATGLAACKNISSGMNPRDRHPERKGEVYPQVHDTQNGNYYGVTPQEMQPQIVVPSQEMPPQVAVPSQEVQPQIAVPQAVYPQP